MKNSVVSEQYLQLQKDIQKMHENWLKQIDQVEINNATEIASLQVPIIPQLQVQINLEQYKNHIIELYDLISTNNNDIKEATNKVIPLLTTATLEKWFEMALAVNTYYFEKFAKENDLEEWILFYGAETAARPFMQNILNQINEKIVKQESTKSCACCGEPARLGIVNKEGKKEMICPRCSYKWQVKMIQCAHCGAETQKVLRVENDDSAEVQACTTCNQYSKIIDSRKLLRLDTPAILDVKYLHLDFIAQDRGYGIEEESHSTH